MSTDRCGSCGASLAPDAPWCSLCLTPRPAPAPAPAPTARRVEAPALYPAVTGASLGRAGVDPTVAPGWPCQACREPVPMTADVCPHCGASFLAGTAGELPAIRLPLVGDLSERSKVQTYALAGAAGLLLALLVVGLVALVAALT